jgi:hypothetical protein
VSQLPAYLCLRCQSHLEDLGDSHLVDDKVVRVLPKWLSVAVLRCPNCGHIELFDRKVLDRTIDDIVNPHQGVNGGPDMSAEEEASMINLGIRWGGDGLPPEDPEVARMYEEDADWFENVPDKDMPIG